MMLMVISDVGYEDGLSGAEASPELFNEPGRSLYLKAYEAGQKEREALARGKASWTKLVPTSTTTTTDKDSQ